MAAVPRDMRDADSVRRRELSPRPDRRRRPRLLRASATEPSITTTSNASRGAMTSPQSTQRATELLNRVAVFSGPAPECSPTSSSAPPMASLSAEDVTTPKANRAQGHREYHPYSNGYFSFPNFDAWDGERHREEKEEDG
ncbi:hypothetical protein CPLU01_10794 [Colletotrichum plurivorum]|uniref:Uncharacterized protein n=1 Tax=Colletotrichum plurivorum TaxID=2175906 RepID=A0A8H6N8V6_9PEZI|nr:hypothetical protein CPLU01_10794 [Colletotrichum plurivorum]